MAVASVTLGYGAGSMIGFYLGRTLLRGCSARALAQTKVLAALDAALGGPSGLRLNVLLRLLLVVPYKALMYGLALTQTSLNDFVAGFVVGGLPYAAVMCWLGALLSGLESASDVSGAADPLGQPAVLALYACGAAATIALAVCLQRAATGEIDAKMRAAGELEEAAGGAAAAVEATAAATKGEGRATAAPVAQGAARASDVRHMSPRKSEASASEASVAVAETPAFLAADRSCVGSRLQSAPPSRKASTSPDSTGERWCGESPRSTA